MASGTIKSVIPRSDIVNNLTTNDSTKVLSAAQGKALKDAADTLSSNLVYKNLGSFTAVSGLISALDTELASMSNYTQRAIRFNFTTADGAFGAYYYLGILSRGSAIDYCSLFVETFSNKSNPHSVDGSKNGTWGFNNLNFKLSNLVGIYRYTINASSTKTITLGNSSRARIETFGNSGNMISELLAYTSGSGATRSAVVKGGSDITYAISTGGIITITNANSGSNGDIIVTLYSGSVSD